MASKSISTASATACLLYTLGDSIDMIYANSSTNTPANVLVPGGGLGINGKGEIWGLRYNHIFPRAGEYSSRLVLAYDRKYLDNTCDQLGVSHQKPCKGVIGPCTPYTIQPVSVTYSGQWQRPGESIDFLRHGGAEHRDGRRLSFPGGGPRSHRSEG
jgi:hypothetical protein